MPSRTLHTDLVQTARSGGRFIFRDPATGWTARVIFHAYRGTQYTFDQPDRVVAQFVSQLHWNSPAALEGQERIDRLGTESLTVGLFRHASS